MKLLSKFEMVSRQITHVNSACSTLVPYRLVFMYDLTFIKLHTIETPKNTTKSRSSFVTSIGM